MKIRQFLWLISGLFLIHSCTGEKSGNGTAPDDGMLRIRASIEGTKAYLSRMGMFWNSGDSISVFSGTEHVLFKTTDSGESAVFRGEADDADCYYVQYPYRNAAIFDGRTFIASVPEIQIAQQHTPRRGLCLLAGVARRTGKLTHEAKMQHICSYFSFKLDNSATGISGVSLQASGGESIAGDLRADIAEGNIGQVSCKGASSVSLTTPDGNILDGTYYIVLAPAILSDGLRLTANLKDGGQKVFEFTGIGKLEPGHIYSFPAPIDGDDIGANHESLLEDICLLGQVGNETLDQERTPWNSWADAASLRASLDKAVSEGRTYFSNFKFYDYATSGSLDTPRSRGMGFPFMYSVDFYEGSGVYFPEVMRAPIKENLLNIIKTAWAKNRSIPLLSWHLESPYAVYETFGEKMGCRYTYLAEGFPQEHRYMVREILENKQVDTLGIGKVGDWFDERCREVAGIINQFVDDSGNPIPFIFRLWHEQEDSWAWWDYDEHVSVSDYKAFFRLTVAKFREYCPNAQILFAYAPDRYFESEEKYLKTWPGDDVVDVIGYDDYEIGYVTHFSGDSQAALNASLLRGRIVSKIAKEKNKAAVLFETNNKCEGYQDVFFSTYVQTLLQDPEVNLSIFQIWSDSYSSDVQKTSMNEFIRSDNIIFDH